MDCARRCATSSCFLPSCSVSLDGLAPSLATSSVVPGLFETCSADGSHAVHDLVAAISFLPALAVRLPLVQSVTADSLRASTSQDATTSKRRGRAAVLSSDVTVGLALHA